jgi:uncharacterized protein YjiS (DUF1127 family)
MVMHSSDFSLRKLDRARPQSAWPLRLFAALARASSGVRAELRARRAAAELASLDDRMLRDIGVSRCEIQSLVRRPIVSAQTQPLGWWRRE